MIRVFIETHSWFPNYNIRANMAIITYFNIIIDYRTCPDLHIPTNISGFINMIIF